MWRCYLLSNMHQKCLFHRTYGAVYRDNVACFKVSNFITLNSSPKLGEVPEGRRGLSSPQKQTKTMSVCFWESGGTSCPNDDRVIGPCNLVTEREVIGQCDLIVERDWRYELPASHYNFIKYYDNLFLLINCCTFVL